MAMLGAMRLGEWIVHDGLGKYDHLSNDGFKIAYRPLTETGRSVTTNPPQPDPYRKPIQDHGGNKYIRTITSVDGTQSIRVDVYAIIKAFNVTCPGRQQALKKILCAGLRGKGSQIDDIHGVFDAMWRALELQIQEEQEKPVTTP